MRSNFQIWFQTTICLQEMQTSKRSLIGEMKVHSVLMTMMGLTSLRDSVTQSQVMKRMWKRRKNRKIFNSMTLWCLSWNTIAKRNQTFVLFEYKLSHNNLALQTGQSLCPRSHLKMQFLWNRCPHLINRSPFCLNSSMQIGHEFDCTSGCWSLWTILEGSSKLLTVVSILLLAPLIQPLMTSL